MSWLTKRWWQVAVAGAVPLAVGLSVHQQGFNLLDDGLWLLGTRVLSQGDLLYRDLFSIYGPARYLLLLPFFAALGQSALTLAVFKAVVDGLAGACGFVWLRKLGAGRWAWLAPLGVLAVGPILPRYLAATAFTMAVGTTLVGSVGRRRAWGLGLAWGGLALFGLDMAAYGAVIVVGGWMVARWLTVDGGVRPRLPWGPLVGGLAGVLGLAAVAATATGCLGTVWWDTVVYPVTRFGEGMGLSWLNNMRDGSALRNAFAGTHTGENLTAVWPGQVASRVLGLRLMFALAWLAPMLLLVAARWRRDARWGVVAALAVASWATLLARGDVAHLRLIWFGVLLALALVASAWSTRSRLGGGVATGILLLALGPLAAEQLWLASHRGREGLQRWDTPRARVLLGEERLTFLVETLTGLDWDESSPLLVWPAQPGLAFVLEATLPTPQATLLAGEVRESGTVIAELERSGMRSGLLGRAWGLVPGVRRLELLAPELWSYLRRHFIWSREYVRRGEVFREIHRVPGGAVEIATMPPRKRLHGAACFMNTASSPPIRPGVSVAQSMRVIDFDLAGLSLMLGAPGPFPYPVSFELHIATRGLSGAIEPLAVLPVSFELEETVVTRSFPFLPVRGTRGREVLVAIKADPNAGKPFAVMWHMPGTEGHEPLDYYPDGEAYLNGKPTGGDLYFVSY